MELETRQEGDLIRVTATMNIKDIIPSISYKDLLIAIKNLRPVQPDFFLFMHTEDLAKYQDKFDKDYLGNYSIRGIRIVFNQCAEKGKVQPLPIKLLDFGASSIRLRVNPFLPKP